MILHDCRTHGKIIITHFVAFYKDIPVGRANKLIKKEHDSISNHAKKMLFSESYVVTLSGTLDRIDNRFNVIERLKADLTYVDDVEKFKKSLINFVLYEYAKDKTANDKVCNLFMAHKSDDGSIIHENISIKSNGEGEDVTYNSILNVELNLPSISKTIEKVNIDHLLPVGFKEKLYENEVEVEPDFQMDHNHLYEDKMPELARNIIPVLFMASYYEIKGHLPSAESIELLKDDEIRQIGILFYEKFDLYKGEEDDSIGFFEDGFRLS